MSTDYYWCWIGLGVNLAYILLLNAMIVTLLAFLPAYGAHATVAKTSEELEDRRAALYGDEGTDASDIVVNFQTHDDGVSGHSNGQDHNRIQVLEENPGRTIVVGNLPDHSATAFPWYLFKS